MIARWHAGTTMAWNEVIGKYRPLLSAQALGILKNEEDVEEIVQDSFISAHRNLSSFRGDCSLSTWLCTIAKRKSLNRYHYWRRRRRADSQPLEAPINESGQTFAEVIPDDAPGPRARVGLGEDIHAIAVAIQNLTSPERSLVLERAGGASYEQLAASRGLQLGTVKSRLARARYKLLQQLTT